MRLHVAYYKEVHYSVIETPIPPLNLDGKDKNSQTNNHYDTICTPDISV